MPWPDGGLSCPMCEGRFPREEGYFGHVAKDLRRTMQLGGQSRWGQSRCFSCLGAYQQTKVIARMAHTDPEDRLFSEEALDRATMG